MLARFATFNSAPSDLDDPRLRLLREKVKATPGFVAGFHMLDATTGKAYSLGVFEDEQAVRAAQEALAERPLDHRVGVDADKIEWFEARQF